MTLTEEQRAAIKLAMKYIARWPFAYKELHARGVLQAMIDSSEHIREPPKMVGFDLERARGLRDFLQDDCAEVGDVWAEMIAEIERLRADNAGLSKAVISIQEERDLAQAEFRAYHKAWEEQAIEIERLQGFETAARDLNNDLIRIAGERDELAARIQELEDALVEMVATNPCNIPTLCDVVHDELMCLALDGNCDFWKGCPQKNELRKAARKQLRAEGKIGPDADAKPQVWQITEERKAALWHAINVLKENDIMEEPEGHLWDEEVTVLQAMLTEAGQE